MIKKILIIIAVILTIAGTYTARDLLYAVAVFLVNHPAILAVVIFAVAIQLVGHWFRAMRTKIVLDQAAPSSMRFQFGALSIGYLFNTLLPFRLGELIRALLIAQRLRISFLYTFVAIIIERATDVIFLTILIIVGLLILKSSGSTGLLLVLLAASLIAVLLLYVLLLLKNENKYLLSFISWFTNLFNDSISNRLRFKIWSLIFGLQNFFGKSALVRKYILYAVVSWLCYFVSISIIVVALLHLDNILQVVTSSISPYILSFNPLDASSYHQLATFLPVHISSGNLDVYAKIIWIILMIPMAVIGFVALFLYRSGVKRKPSRKKTDPYTNKLLRHEDISQEFPAFLETYFKGYSLSRILHKIELTGELSLVKFFKGGSDAITVLALKGDQMFVKKIVPAEHADRLGLQYKWLKKHAGQKQIVNVLAQHKADDYYAIDLSYNPEHISLFEYIHTRSLNQAKQAINHVWAYVARNIYVLQKESVNESERDSYIEDRLMKKVEYAAKINEDLGKVIDEKQIKINGETYDNFYTIMNKIKGNKQAWHDLAVYRKSTTIHGDLTIDNILMDPRTDKPFIIDPSDDNQIRGPVIDFGRHMQSLVSGYEFLNNDDEAVKATRRSKFFEINYHDHRSAAYMQLDEYVRKTIAPKYLTATEQKTVLFHTGLLFGRMLAHRVVINPHNTLKYYAVSVVLLNRFYALYKDAK